MVFEPEAPTELGDRAVANVDLSPRFADRSLEWIGEDVPLPVNGVISFVDGGEPVDFIGGIFRLGDPFDPTVGEARHTAPHHKAVRRRWIAQMNRRQGSDAYPEASGVPWRLPTLEMEEGPWQASTPCRGATRLR